MDAGMYATSVPVFSRMLKNLSAILDKGAKFAESRGIDASVLLQSRLYPDMFPLVRQVQVASDTAKGAAARLGGRDVPKFEDNETSFADLQSRIAKTVAFIESVDHDAVDASAGRPISIPRGQRTVETEGLVYLTQGATPNFYFHVTMAYAILRHNGVELGKGDFLGL